MSEISDKERFDYLLYNSYDLRCFNVPTGGDDFDIGWRVIGHWQEEPHDRVISEVFHDDPRLAVDEAIQLEKKPAVLKETKPFLGAV